MVETIKIPGYGEANKRTAYVAIGGVVLLGGIAYYRHKKNAATTSATTDPTQIDPSTGFPYGSPQDAQTLAQSAGYVDPAQYAGVTGGVGPGSSPPTTQTVQIATNPQWQQAAVDYLSNTVGMPTGTVSAACAKYIAGEAVSPAEKSIIEQAIAAVGTAPQSGVNGFPPSIKDEPAGPSSNKPASVHLSAPHLEVASKSTKTALLRWSSQANVGVYHLFRNGLPAGIWLKPNLTTYTVPLHSGAWAVKADGIAGKSYSSPESNPVKV